MTALDNIRRITARGQESFRARANAQLKTDPIEAVHPDLGLGVLLGVNPSGQGVFWPNGSDMSFPVDLGHLREAN